MPTNTPTIETLKHQLEESLIDTRLSDDEKRQLTDALMRAKLPEEALRQLRNRAFDMVRDLLINEPDNNDPLALVRWLEGVVRAVDVTRGGVRQDNAYFSPGDECRRAIIGQLQGCRQSADICVFTLSDDHISEQVLATHRRGVAVRLITDNEKVFDDGSDVLALQKAGVPVRVDKTPAHMHHKFAIFDRKRIINGSYNWTRSAGVHNLENIVLSHDHLLVEQFNRAFDALWIKLASS